MNILEEYGFLTREEYEKHCFKITSELYDQEIVAGAEPVKRHRLIVQSLGVGNRYPKTIYEAKSELRKRGLDPGDDDYGLARVIESGEVAPAGNMWKKSDIDLAMISLAEFNCIEPWVHICKSFNIRPVEYVKALRAVAEENLERFGFDAAEPILYRFEFCFGNVYSEPGNLSIALRENWKEIAQSLTGRSDAAEER